MKEWLIPFSEPTRHTKNDEANRSCLAPINYIFMTHHINELTNDDIQMEVFNNLKVTYK